MPESYADVAETVFYSEDGGTTPCTVFKPAAFAEGQLLLVVIACDIGPITDMTAPAGWTEEENAVDQGNMHVKVWSHWYGVADPSTWDFGYNGAGNAALGLFRIVHADAASPVVVNAVPTFSSSAGATLNSPTVTPSTAHDLLLTAIAYNGAGSAFSTTAPSGMTDLGQVQFVGAWMAVAAAKELLVAPGATGTRTWTSISPTGHEGAALSIAVKDSNTFDPDPPRIPPLPTISESLLMGLLAAKSRPFVGHGGTAWVQEKLSGSASGASVTLTTAVGTHAGDVLYCFHGNDFYTAAGLTTPTGTAGTWTLEATGDGGTNGPHKKLWRRVVTVDGAQTVTVAPNSDEEVTSELFVISGADASNPTDAAAGSNGTASTAHVAPALTPTSAYPLMLCGVQGAQTSATFTPPPLMAELSDIFGGSVAIQVLPATGVTTGTRTFTSSVSQAFATVSVAIRAGSGVIVSTDATATPGTVTATAVIATPTVVVATDATVTATTVTATASITAPTVQAGAVAAPSTVAATTGIGSPTVTVSGSATATPATVAAVATVPAPTVQAGSTVSAATVAGVATVPAPVVQAGARPAPAVVAAVASVGTPAVVTGSTVSPATVAAVATIPAPTIQAGAQPAPSVVAGTAAVGTVTVQAGSTVSPATVAATATIPTPSLGGSVVVNPATVAAVATIPAGTPQAGAVLTAATVVATATVPAPTVQAGARPAPSTVAGVAAVGAPTVRLSVTIGPTTVSAVTTVPVVSIRAGAAPTPATVAALASVGAPTVKVGVTVAAATVAAVATIPAPTVFSPPSITTRPFTGVTTRPTTGTTTRPGSGTTARPGSGITVRPYTGTTVRP